MPHGLEGQCQAKSGVALSIALEFVVRSVDVAPNVVVASSIDEAMVEHATIEHVWDADVRCAYVLSCVIVVFHQSGWEEH